MKKGEYIQTLTYRLYQEFVDKLSLNVNNYTAFFDIWNRDAIINRIISDARKYENYKINEDEEGIFYMLLDKQYDSTLERARKTVLQSLKAKQMQQQKELENSKEYQQAQLKKEFKDTLKSIFKESRRLTKKGLGTIGLIGVSSAIGFAKGCKEDNHNSIIK